MSHRRDQCHIQQSCYISAAKCLLRKLTPYFRTLFGTLINSVCIRMSSHIFRDTIISAKFWCLVFQIPTLLLNKQCTCEHCQLIVKEISSSQVIQIHQDRAYTSSLQAHMSSKSWVWCRRLPPNSHTGVSSTWSFR